MDNHKILIYSYWLSVICLIHCISFPIIIAILPVIGIVFEINEWIEIGIILSVLIFGSYSLIHAYITHHKNIKPLVIFYFGMSISFYIHFIAHDHSSNALILEIISGAIIAGAQFYNLKITPKTCNNPLPHKH
ncbi:MAG: hypothetical protein ACI8ZX_002438 [Planctomycetota bacterium]|jgi:hypothetical protein